MAESPSRYPILPYLLDPFERAFNAARQRQRNARRASGVTNDEMNRPSLPSVEDDAELLVALCTCHHVAIKKGNWSPMREELREIFANAPTKHAKRAMAALETQWRKQYEDWESGVGSREDTVMSLLMGRWLELKDERQYIDEDKLDFSTTPKIRRANRRRKREQDEEQNDVGAAINRSGRAARRLAKRQREQEQDEIDLLRHEHMGQLQALATDRHKEMRTSLNSIDNTVWKSHSMIFGIETEMQKNMREIRPDLEAIGEEILELRDAVDNMQQKMDSMHESIKTLIEVVREKK